MSDISISNYWTRANRHLWSQRLLATYIWQCGEWAQGRGMKVYGQLMPTCLLIVAGYLLSILPIDPNTDQHYTTSIPNALAMEYIRMLHMHEYEVHVYTYLSSMKWSTTVYPMMYYSVAWWSIGWGMPASLSRPYLIILLCLGRKFTPSYVMRNTARAHEAPVRGGIYIRTYRQAHWLHWHVPAYASNDQVHTHYQEYSILLILRNWCAIFCSYEAVCQ